ncbi:GNAT family N-acetyltransferase [Aestuariicoccus sp. MJ-SS9]|uniref:GNAT family N-acetyltransferase n=1 Tax=Aestuariicoccus sp. MJ-SS9 TaxID=3079855 RepID=UPI00290A4227|nr:GNAT family N-acetyltransferase [Aestuariicoccus sp. MJ-SS9]MDU8912733.1 GNAT family N-acetyltransferase [Aestuariicoccus sp. MJ-SS9]
MTAGLDIREARTPEDFDAVRDLCWDYRDFLLELGPKDAAIVRHFYPRDGYAKVMARLETDHAPPSGSVKLARLDGAAVGCGMLHRLEPGTAEIKRVYVRDAARGRGAGRALMQALIAQCRDMGFRRILMDTGKPLTTATALYLSMGFRLRGPYQPVPDLAKDHLIFFQMDL